MNRVEQEHPMGCGVACVAMVVGKDYAEVAALFPGWDGSTGKTHHAVEELLHHHGYAYSMLYATDQFTNTPRQPWPVPPFADAHIVCVESPIGAHYVVWLKDGSVLDPIRPGPLTLADYGRVHHIIGVFPDLMPKKG